MSSPTSQATGETGISNSGLIVGHAAAIAVDALMVPSMTRRLVAAVKKTTRKPVARLVNTHHHLDHTGGNRFFRGATIIASEKCREELAPGFPPVPLLQRFMPAFAAEFPKLTLELPNVMRCYQEFRDETHLPLDIPTMLEGMERLRGGPGRHTCR